MPVVTNTVKYPNGTVAAGRVTIDLVGENGRPLTDGAFVSASDFAIQASYSADLASGVWSVTLTANELINPAGTRWRVSESVDGRLSTYYIEVPTGGGPHFVEDILDEAPSSVPSSALAAHAADLTLHRGSLFAAGLFAANAAQRAVLGNGLSKPLSSFYPSLAAAQADYADATSLTQELDWAVIQTGLTAGYSILVTDGDWRTTTDLRYRRTGQKLCGIDVFTSSIDYRGDGGYAVIFGRHDYNPMVGEFSANYRRIVLADIEVKGTNSTGAAGGVKVHGATRWEMSRVYVHHFADGPGIAYYDYSWIGTLNTPWIEDCERALWFISHSIDSANQSANAMNVIGGEIGAGCTYGVVTGDETATAAAVPSVGTVINFIGTVIEGTDSWGAWLVEGNSITFSMGYFENCGAETAGTSCIKIGNAAVRPTSVSIKNVGFLGTSGSDSAAIHVERVEYLYIHENKFDCDAVTDTTTGIKLVSGSCDHVDIGPNKFGGSIDTHIDEGALAANWASRRINVAGTVEEHRSGTNGWRWRAAVAYVHEFMDAANAVATRFGLNGGIFATRPTAGNLWEGYVAGGGLAGSPTSIIKDTGVALFGDGSVSLPGIAFSSDTNTGLFRVGADQFDLVIGGVTGARMNAPADGETAILLRRNVGGTLTLQRVSMGAADSGGSGFKVLRVPN